MDAERLRQGMKFLPSFTASNSIVKSPAYFDPLGANRMMVPDPNRMMETCAGKAVFSAVIGM
jgi:hypothetical protein